MSDDKLREAAQDVLDAWGNDGDPSAGLFIALAKALSPDTGNDHVPAFARNSRHGEQRRDCGMWRWTDEKGNAHVDPIAGLTYIRTLEQRLDRAGDIMANMDVIATALARRVEALEDGR